MNKRSREKMILQTQGAAAIEFAILLPFLAALVFGIIEFGLLLYDQQVITNASREGARAAIVGDCDQRLPNDDIIKIVTNYCSKRLITFAKPTPLPVTIISTNSPLYAFPKDCNLGGPGLTVGEDVKVTVQYTYTFLVPSILGFGPTKVLSARTVMKMESAP